MLFRRRYILPPDRTRPTPWWRSNLHWLLPLLVLDMLGLVWWFHRAPPSAPPTLEPPAAPALEPAIPAPRPRSQLADLRMPTSRDLRGDPLSSGLIQATASGKPESGLFGSVRTANGARGLTARFHEGVDIAPMARDRRGRPTDTVHAIAPGTVAFVNKTPGNSDYGIYVALTHADDVGPVYTLYAHLASVDHSVQAGRDVAAGQQLGKMGNTSLMGVPMARAHLHLEIGMLLNPRFADWAARRPEKHPGGNYNGLNLFGVDPIDVFRFQGETADFNFRAYLATAPEAFLVACRGSQPPLFFEQHPLLWDATGPATGVMVFSVAESGLPLQGRHASEAERAVLGTAPACILRADAAVLGRNGRRHVLQRGDRWILGPAGETWLQTLTFRP